MTRNCQYYLTIPSNDQLSSNRNNSIIPEEKYDEIRSMMIIIDVENISILSFHSLVLNNLTSRFIFTRRHWHAMECWQERRNLVKWMWMNSSKMQTRGRQMDFILQINMSMKRIFDLLQLRISWLLIDFDWNDHKHQPSIENKSEERNQYHFVFFSFSFFLT